LTTHLREQRTGLHYRSSLKKKKKRRAAKSIYAIACQVLLEQPISANDAGCRVEGLQARSPLVVPRAAAPRTDARRRRVSACSSQLLLVTHADGHYHGFVCHLLDHHSAVLVTRSKFHIDRCWWYGQPCRL